MEIKIDSSGGGAGGSTGPVEFVKDGLPTAVNEDTVTPANNVLLPVKLLSPVSVSASALPTGAATEATLSAVSTSATSIATNTTGLNLLAKNAGAADANTLRTKLADADATVLAGLQTSLTAIDAGIPTALGQATMANSMPVTLASNQSAVPISAASLPLPTGAATETTLAAASAKLPATLGQKTMANSLAVTLASDQAALPVTDGVPAALTVKQAAITVGTTAVRLTTDALAPSSTRRRLRFQPDANATGDFYYGAATVTSTGATRGCQIFPAQTEEFLNDVNEYYIISTVAAQTVFIVEVE